MLTISHDLPGACKYSIDTTLISFMNYDQKLGCIKLVNGMSLAFNNNSRQNRVLDVLLQPGCNKEDLKLIISRRGRDLSTIITVGDN